MPYPSCQQRMAWERCFNNKKIKNATKIKFEESHAYVFASYNSQRAWY